MFRECALSGIRKMPCTKLWLNEAAILLQESHFESEHLARQNISSLANQGNIVAATMVKK